MMTTLEAKNGTPAQVVDLSVAGWDNT